MVDRGMVIAIVAGTLAGLCVRAVMDWPSASSTASVPPRCARMCQAAPDRDGCESRCTEIVARHAVRPTSSPMPARTEGVR